ncbi:MAG: RluA family pseudouridine synthase [Oscillospiraceae bacterium]|nr:RluA family pseudouridine synthase [Oscillospiraceae bacterium]
MQIVYEDAALVVCLKPPGVLSTDEPGGVPELLREQLGLRELRTVHRLDRVVGGLMALAKSAQTASELSRQIREGGFEKRYLAVVHGLTEKRGELRDLLARDRVRCLTYVADAPGKGVQEAVLRFETLGYAEGLSLVRIELLTGRTHQIRCQFSARGLPLVGDRKYGLPGDECAIALWSHELAFAHPGDGRALRFTAPPPAERPWTLF